MRSTLLLLLLSLVPACAEPDPVDTTDHPASGELSSGAIDPRLARALHTSLEQGIAAQHALGAAVAIVVPGQGVWEGACGLDGVGGRALTVDELYPIGSVTKTFTAVVILQLVEEGKLSLHATLSTWYPHFPGASEIHVSDLLQHTSGIADYGGDPDADGTQPIAHEHILDWPATQPLHFRPGTSWEYSNTNYILLGLIAERVTGQRYATLVHARVIDRIGLTHTFLDGDDVIPSRVVRGSSNVHGTFVDRGRTDPSWAWSAGALVSTLDDQVRFVEALHDGELLTPTSMSAMKRGVQMTDAPPGFLYGLGLEWGPTQWGTFYEHPGIFQDVKSVSGDFPGAGVAVIAYANTFEANPYPIAFAAADDVLP
jgi:D-alanyl-D-alanine carboxypeptidase